MPREKKEKKTEKPVQKETFERISKDELVSELSENLGISKRSAKENLDAVINIIREKVAEGKEVPLIGFGTFKPSKRNERTGRNPQTGDEVKIKASVVPVFKAGRPFKDLVKSKLK